MNAFKPLLYFFTLFVLFIHCTGEHNEGLLDNQAEVKEMTDEEYPDNNDIETRCDAWAAYQHDVMEVIRHGEEDFTVIFYPTNELSDTLLIEHVNLLAWIPTIPDHITDEYLKHIGIINAEWNRHQVKLVKGEFRFSGEHEEHNKTVRVDLARNCLNAYAWELITYTEEEGKQSSMYHGWFNFPQEMYRELFDEVNEGKLTFAEYKDHLEEYKDPRKEFVDLDHLRTIIQENEVAFENLNHLSYPKTGARKSKYKNIVYPKNPQVINDLLNDLTQFSTFQWPGWYDTKDPRPSTLSMLGIPKKVMVRRTVSANTNRDTCYEFDVTFARNTDISYLTRVVIGGVKPSDLRQMPMQEYNSAFKKPMGIGNHPFYEGVKDAEATSTKDSPYYAFILDEEGKWVDSHFFGVDGPIFHLDENDPNILHYWLLSFERHAMVTHLTFTISEGGESVSYPPPPSPPPYNVEELSPVSCEI